MYYEGRVLVDPIVLGCVDKHANSQILHGLLTDY